MTQVRRHAPGLKYRLNTYVQSGDATGLLNCLHTLSHQDMRTAGYLLGHELLPKYPNNFWALFSIVPTNPKALLGTFLRALEQLLLNKSFILDTNHLESFSKQATPIDAQKLLSSTLPLLHNPKDIHFLLRTFTDNTPQSAIKSLIGIPTNAACYELFSACRKIEGDTATLRHICILLMQRNTPLFHNLASMLQSYFDLGPLPGSFALRLEKYQISRIEESYDTFVKILRR